MRVLLVCLVASLVLAGCRKKSNPEFYKLEGAQSVLVTREGDDGWVSPEMDTIVSGLQAIPADALEKPRAEALVATIAAEQARVKRERTPVAPPPAQPDPFAGRTTVTPEPQGQEEEPSAPEGGEAVDAGEPAQPWTGMDEKKFLARFGSCFKAGAPITLPTGQPASSYVLLVNKPECQKQFGAPNGVLSYLFTEKGLWGKATETTQIVDGGTVTLPAPPQPPPPAPQPPIITTPGAPQPEGYDKAPLDPLDAGGR